LAGFTACFDSVLKSQQRLSLQQAGLQHEGLQPAAQQQVSPQQQEATLVALVFTAAAPLTTAVRANAPTRPSIPRRFMF
jgi:hypothetical protein